MIQNLFKLLKEIYNFENIIIFGAGERGKRLLNHLKNSDINVFCFCDNDLKKQNQIVDGTMCYSLDQIPCRSDDSIFFVSPKNSDDIFKALKKKYRCVLPSAIVEIMISLPIGYTDFLPIGHFYSLYPDLNEMRQKENELYDLNRKSLDININEREQIDLLLKLKQQYTSIPTWKDIEDEGESDYRYRYNNTSFSPTDAIGLHCMLRDIKPGRLIEVGSGWTSAVTLDTNEYYLDNNIKLTFIEPYPERLKSILKKSDNIELLEKKLQEVDVKVFSELGAGDILFIDSTHVSKMGSDVNYLFFEILPRLKKGVYIHLHDIFYPFEYPMHWVEKGMAWNEIYLLRAFLQNNKKYKIVYFQNMLERLHNEKFLEDWPLEDKSIGGGSFWMQKVED